jgi:low temperature requirement protein LtrA
MIIHPMTFGAPPIYLHLAMVGGIVFIAMGVQHTFANVEKPLPMIPAGALCGGCVLYLLGLFCFRLRVTSTLHSTLWVRTVSASRSQLIHERWPSQHGPVSGARAREKFVRRIMAS